MSLIMVFHANMIVWCLVCNSSLPSTSQKICLPAWFENAPTPLCTRACAHTHTHTRVRVCAHNPGVMAFGLRLCHGWHMPDHRGYRKFDVMPVMWRLSLSVASNEAPTLTSITDPRGDAGGPFVQIAPPLSVRFRAGNLLFLSPSACLCLTLCCAIPLPYRFIHLPFF